MNHRPVTLRQHDEISLTTGVVRRSQSQSAKRTVYPWYPLAGHREGLRANDMISLHSAFVIIAFHGGTAHVAPQPGTIVNGNVVPFQG